MKNLLSLGSVYMVIGVGFGAFGAHGLQSRLTQLGTLEVYKTGVQYHLIHALAVLFLAMLYDKVKDRRRVEACGWLFAVGIVLFSGSLYMLAITGVKILGAVTPLGGLCFLIAWALLAGTALRE